ncbi:unnamed protein product, partial [Phaeothamnion confervicola]
MKPTSKAPAACTSAVEISELLLAAFAFLGARDLGRSGSVSKSWRDLSSDDQTWRDLYDRCQRCAETCDPWVKRLAERPRGRDAMGRAVMVWDEDTESGRKGTIVDFDAALGFQVQYVDGGEPRWELEARTRGRWHCRGKSRFTFLEDGDDTAWYPAQGSSSGGDGGDGSDGGRGSIGGGTEATADNSLADGTCPALARSSSFGGDACWSDAVKAGGGAARWLPRRGHWKREYRQNTRHVPRRCVETLRDHTDEVLDLDFSHDGCHLASCSRDYYIYVYEVLFGPDAVPPPMPPLLRRERCSAATAAGTGADAAAAEAAVGGAAGAGNTVLTNTAAVLRSDADIMDAAVAFKPSLTARSDDEAGEAATKAAAAGPWSFRRIQALRSEPLACICRVMWSPCDRFLLAAVEEPHGQPFGNKSESASLPCFDGLHGLGGGFKVIYTCFLPVFGWSSSAVFDFAFPEQNSGKQPIDCCCRCTFQTMSPFGPCNATFHFAFGSALALPHSPQAALSFGTHSGAAACGGTRRRPSTSTAPGCPMGAASSRATACFPSRCRATASSATTSASASGSARSSRRRTNGK